MVREYTTAQQLWTHSNDGSNKIRKKKLNSSIRGFKMKLLLLFIFFFLYYFIIFFFYYDLIVSDLFILNRTIYLIGEICIT